ncbi:MAG: ribonuclease HII [Epsilonproteobacteria bacterium]|nr:ribonuclease HII [Campylobacterota bacterium]
MAEVGEGSLCGIDEAGRGSLAGPLVVAGVVLLKKIDGLDDSKKLTPKKREEMFDKIISNSIYKIVFTNNKTIDKIGLSQAIKTSILKIKKRCFANKILMDGNTNFGILGVRHLIKADSKIPQVSAASILAKVARDRYMVKISKKYPIYSFERHKGYGTKEHIEAIQNFGYCDIHRKSFEIKSFKQPSLF